MNIPIEVLICKKNACLDPDPTLHRDVIHALHHGNTREAHQIVGPGAAQDHIQRVGK